MFRNVLFYVLFVALLGAIGLGLPMFLPQVKLLSPHFWLAFAFLALITFLAYITALIGIRQAKGAGVMVIMMAFFVKLLSCMVFMLIYSQKQHPVTLIFVFNFFILYFFFTLFEIYGLLCNLRHQNKK